MKKYFKHNLNICFRQRFISVTRINKIILYKLKEEEDITINNISGYASNHIQKVIAYILAAEKEKVFYRLKR